MAVTEFSSLSPRYRVIVAIAKSGQTQEQIAKQIGVSPATVSAWVKGKRTPTLDQMFALASVTGERDILDFSGLADLHDPSSGWMWETAGQAA